MQQATQQAGVRLDVDTLIDALYPLWTQATFKNVYKQTGVIGSTFPGHGLSHVRYNVLQVPTTTGLMPKFCQVGYTSSTQNYF